MASIGYELHGTAQRGEQSRYWLPAVEISISLVEGERSDAAKTCDFESCDDVVEEEEEESEGASERV